MSGPFEIFGLPAEFDVDLGELADRHRELSRALHPDRHVDQPPLQRRQALSRALEVNDAFRVLRDPLKRAQVLLDLAGVNQNQETSPAFLMEVMERREALSEAGRSRDVGRLDELVAEVNQEKEEKLGALSQAFKSGDLNQVGHFLGELRYLFRFVEEARALGDELT